jgi:hypothetical protein
MEGMEQVTESKHLTKAEATEFFAEFYDGRHHIPKSGVKEFGDGWYVSHNRGDLATYDYNQLTRLVLMGHDKCIRVSVAPSNFNTLKICIWKRQREGGMSSRHPTLEQAIEKFRTTI